MAGPGVSRASSSVADQSIGDLVSVAARDISQLVRYELDLAKLELKSDIKRAVISAALAAIAVFSACLILMVLCFAYAYGLNAAGARGGMWGAFLLVAATCAVLILTVLLIVWLVWRRLTKLSRTRRTLADDTSLVRRAKSAARTATKVG
jgi:uncharacterized membrane protein